MEIDEHPLAYLLHRHGWTSTSYLARLSVVHRQLGHGSLDPRQRKRVSRWIRSGITPERAVQTSMAALHGIPMDEVSARPWPEFLLLACIDRQLLDGGWTAHNAVDLLDRVSAEGTMAMDRRGFLVVSSAGIAATVSGVATATPAPPKVRGRRIGASTPRLFDQALAILRRQDDQLGSGQVHTAARAHLRQITTALREGSYTETVGRQLHSAAAEAARICAWTAYDSGHHGMAEEFYLTALRTAAAANDPIVTANTLNFWAILRYSGGDPNGAVALTEHALSYTPRIGSRRMEAMLHARQARAHASAGDTRASARSEAAAFGAYDRARDHSPHDEPDCVYWVDLGELHSWAASNASDLNAPARALTHYQAVTTADTDAYPRAAALRCARIARAHLARGDLDAAVHSALDAVYHIGGVDSARGTTTLTDIRTKLTEHRSTPVVRDFLEATT